MTTRILALVTDAYGMRGGIARYNRDLFEALAGNGAEVFVLPRHGNAEGLTLPAGIRQFPAVLGRLRFCLASLGVAWRCRPVDVVFCGHVFMAPFARVVAWLAGARYWLQAHGTEVWTDRRDLVRRAIEAADMVSTVSRATRRLLLDWVDLAPDRAGPAQHRRRTFHAGPSVGGFASAARSRARASAAHRRPPILERTLQGP